jgi:hypothetical protein
MKVHMIVDNFDNRGFSACGRWCVITTQKTSKKKEGFNHLPEGRVGKWKSVTCKSCLRKRDETNRLHR